MNRKLLSIVLLLSGASYAQIGVGIELPHSSAMLQVHSSEKDQGVLIPEVKLKTLNDGSVVKGKIPAEGLVIFNTTVDLANKISQGYYYWGADTSDIVNPNKWIKIIGSLDVGTYIKENQLFVKVIAIDKTATVGKGFTIDTKEPGIDPFNFTETVTSIEKVKENGKDDKNFIAYNYIDETGKAASTQITITSDVINSFDEIIKDTKVITELNNFITNATGSVTVSKDVTTGNITINYKDPTTNQTQSLDLTTEILRVQKYASLDKNTDSTKNADKVSMSYEFKSGVQDASVVFNETLTSAVRHNAVGNVENVTTIPAPGLIYYEYNDEAGNKRYITVSQDVSNDFSKIVEKNKDVITTIINESRGNSIVSVTHIESVADGFVIKVKDSKDVVNDIKIPLAKVTKTDINSNGVKSGFTFHNGMAGSADIAIAETLTTLVDNKASKLATDLIKHTYLNESLTAVDFSASQDVVDDFNVIVENDNVKNTLLTLIDKSVKNPWFLQGTTNPAVADIDKIFHTGEVAIGGSQTIINNKATNTKLSVNGDVVISGKFFSANSIYADYVFEKYFTGASDLNLTYEFKSLNYIKDFVEKYNHLPGVTKISDLARTENGEYIIDFTQLSIQQLEKIEELYLHTLEQQDKIIELESELEALKIRMNNIENAFLNTKK